MGTVRKTITLTDRQDGWIKTQIAAGRFTDDSEYIRDLIRRDHERSTGFAGLDAAMQDMQDDPGRGPGGKTVPSVGEGDDGDGEPLPDWQRDLIRDRLAALENVPPEERSVAWEEIRKRLFAGMK